MNIRYPIYEGVYRILTLYLSKSGKSKGTTFIETNTVFFACRGMSIFAAQTKHRQILQWK